MAGEPSKINKTIAADKGLKEGISILAREEWIKLQAFCDAAVATNPTTEDEMRTRLKLAVQQQLAGLHGRYRNRSGQYWRFVDASLPAGR